MLADPRSEALVSNFAGQWLLVRNVAGLRPSPELLFHFDGNLQQAFERETSLFFESIIRENRSVLVAGCRLYVPERATGQALRDFRRAR